MRGLMKQRMKTLTISNLMMLIRESLLSLNLTKMMVKIHMNTLILILIPDLNTAMMINITITKKKKFPNQIYKNLKKAPT